jgi:selenocysteine-specific elongation factor
VRLLDKEHVLPGDESWIQVRLDHPIVAARGDRYIVRRASPPETIGGGVILDTAPGQRWKRFKPEVIERFKTLLDGDPLTVALFELAQLRGPVRLDALSLDASQREQALASGQIRAVGESGWVIHAESWRRLVGKAQRTLGDFHATEPLRLGMPRDTLRGALRLEPEVFDAVLGALVDEGRVAVARNGAVCLPDHEVRFTASQEETVRRLWHDFDLAPHAPPTVGQALEIVGDAVLASLIECGDLVRISDDVLLTPHVLREWIAFARDTLHRDEALTVAVLRDHFQTTRRYALDFLERLDALGITRRKGDERVVGSGEWDRLL